MLHTHPGWCINKAIDGDEEMRKIIRDDYNNFEDKLCHYIYSDCITKMIYSELILPNTLVKWLQYLQDSGHLRHFYRNDTAVQAINLTICRRIKDLTPTQRGAAKVILKYMQRVRQWQFNDERRVKQRQVDHERLARQLNDWHDQKRRAEACAAITRGIRWFSQMQSQFCLGAGYTYK